MAFGIPRPGQKLKLLTCRSGSEKLLTIGLVPVGSAASGASLRTISIVSWGPFVSATQTLKLTRALLLPLHAVKTPRPGRSPWVPKVMPLL